MENQLEPLKVECSMPSEEQLKDDCQVFLEESCEKLLLEQDKVPLTEPYEIPCKGTLEELLDGSPQSSSVKLLVKEASGKPLENSSELVVNSPANPTLSPDTLPSSLPLFPTFPNPVPDHSVFPEPETEQNIKQELLLDSLETQVKPKPDSTTRTPHLEQAADSEVKDEIKEEETKTAALLADSFVEPPQFDPSICEVVGTLQDPKEPTIARLLQEKAHYSFSEWPKDRVIISRIDSICQAILKGKWPSTSQQYESPNSAVNTCMSNSAQLRAGYLSARMPLPQDLNLNIPHSIPHIHKERLVTPAFLSEVKHSKCGFEFNTEVPVKPIDVGEKIQLGIPHHGSTLLLNGWQEAAMDLSKPTEIAFGREAESLRHVSHAVQSASHKVANLSSMEGLMGLDMAGILQAGLVHPVTGQIVNGSLRRDDSIMRRRRGRRRNVETLDLGLMKEREIDLNRSKGQPETINHPIVSSTSSQPDCPTHSSSVPSPSDSLTMSVDREAAGKSLMEWLRQNPSYRMELPAFSTSQTASMLQSFAERPKQRRHRCKDPTKLDVNSLTGEERVPVVHRNTGRRLGGAMAPAIKELSQWLDANLEYFVAPDWADVVKHSGFLPEGKFTRILTEPVNRDPNTRRRGRRPRSEMPKAPDLPAGIGPLFLNDGLIGMDLVNLPSLRNVPGIPIGGLMGFPPGLAAALPGEDAKNGLSMLPMMLHSMSAVQSPIYGAHLGGMINQSLSATASTVTTSASSSSTATVTSISSAAVALSPSPAVSSSTAASKERASPEPNDERLGTDERTLGENEKKILSAVPSSNVSSSTASITSSGSHLAFNPFLITGMPHGLLYPHMFLPHGSIMALPSASDSTGIIKQKKKKIRDEGIVDEDNGLLVVHDGKTKGMRDVETLECKHKEGRLEESMSAVDTSKVTSNDPPSVVSTAKAVEETKEEVEKTIEDDLGETQDV
ncbi:hypothetical protein HF521_000369 [Silurus meridionalis]|uniref:BRK domain-containing protein n=2 Tax=Silurus meridionalis TaxID=175797 RepID=A0A8T0BWI2_SILME|nr:hypothetical protein HF521_000369 [Silurus meridionalis]